MSNRRRSIRALALTLGAVWAITSCGLVDGFLDEEEDKDPGTNQAGGSLIGTPNGTAQGPYGSGSGGSAMAGTAGRGGAGGGGNLGGGGDGPLPPRPPGLNAGAPAGQARNDNQRVCDPGDCREAGGQCDGETCVIDCDEDTIVCNDEPLECPDGANCEVNCVDEDTCLDQIICPNGGDCTINCSEAGTCAEQIDCGGSVNCAINCDEDDSCAGGFAVLADRAALTLICRGAGSCSGDTIECGTAGCLLACDGDDTCDGTMQLQGRLSVLDCNGTRACSGRADCSGDEEGCQINCRGADSCLQDMTCGELGRARDCAITCLGPRSCNGNVTCLGDECELACDNDGCAGDVSCGSGTGSCAISCDNGSCNGDVDCAADDACDINCDGNDSCQQDVICDARRGDCVVTCGGDNACDVVSCIADNGTCDLDCNGEDSCLGGTECDGQAQRGDCDIDAD
jgi:hypothetical protein